VGSADALVSLWDADELACLRTFSRLEWPVRAISFSYDGKLLASASEDTIIDIGHVDSGEKVAEVPVRKHQQKNNCIFQKIINIISWYLQFQNL